MPITTIMAVAAMLVAVLVGWLTTVMSGVMLPVDIVSAMGFMIPVIMMSTLLLIMAMMFLVMTMFTVMAVPMMLFIVLVVVFVIVFMVVAMVVLLMAIMVAAMLVVTMPSMDIADIIMPISRFQKRIASNSPDRNPGKNLCSLIIAIFILSICGTRGSNTRHHE